MRRTRVFGLLAALGAALVMAFAAAVPASADQELTEPQGTVSASEIDLQRADAAQENCAAFTNRTDVRIREAPTLDSTVFDQMESGRWYSVACDSTTGDAYDDCDGGFHWLELYIGDSIGYVALMCMDGWVEVDV